jgi:hypothetical protein
MAVMLLFVSGCGSGVSLPGDTPAPGGAVTIVPDNPTLPPANPGDTATATSNTSPYGAFPYLPDPIKTPGDTLDVTASDICVLGYSSKVRNVPQSEKDQVYQEYGITSRAPGSYEVDHLISLELGGSNSISNLWPESYTGDWNAHIKDKLENKLHDLVCNGTLDLKSAQQQIATNWIAAYQQYLGQP